MRALDARVNARTEAEWAAWFRWDGPPPQPSSSSSSGMRRKRKEEEKKDEKDMLVPNFLAWTVPCRIFLEQTVEAMYTPVLPVSEWVGRQFVADVQLHALVD